MTGDISPALERILERQGVADLEGHEALAVLKEKVAAMIAADPTERQGFQVVMDRIFGLLMQQIDDSSDSPEQKHQAKTQFEAIRIQLVQHFELGMVQ